MLTHKALEDYLLGLPKAYLDFPFGEDISVYKVPSKPEDKMFALIPQNKHPLQVSLKCDPQLAVLLRERFETVLEGYHLNKKHWNTIIVSGQLSDQEIFDLVLHSYNLVCENDEVIPKIA